ncbi:MAG: cbb3-type cytochrome c oxidase subunit I [Planctomycetaceae bacterium]|nr:cbb3-type cytochrome c oxidase subunit I [Planctomycetaceae bacterium]
MIAFIRKPSSAALVFLVAGAAWFVLGTLYGMTSAIHLVWPEAFNNIPALVFGRTRAIHVNSVLFGFATTTLIGAGLYYMPAVLRTRLWSEPLGHLSALLWNGALISGPITFSLGHSQGREYCELLWWADVAIVASVVIMAANLAMTIAIRRERQLYISVWYFMGTFLWTASFYPIGNVMWRPPEGAMPGLIDSLFLWFYGHNLPGLLLTPLATGAAFFVMPRVTKTPLYSHTLSLIGFWTLVTLYSHIGGHHLLQAPIPTWLKAISVIDSMAMLIPVFTVIANVWLTTRGHGGKLLADPAGRWVTAGIIWYLLVTVQGSLQSLPMIQRVTHFNNWTIGHSHIAILGFAGSIAIGAMWHVLPYVARRSLWSQRLVNLQFLLVTFGLTGFLVVLTIAGLIQGQAWNNGETVYRVLPTISAYMVLRVVFGVLIITGAIIGLVNLILTLTRGQRFEPAPIEQPQEDPA